LELFNIEGISIVNEDPRVRKIVDDYHRLMSQDMEERMRLKRRAENLDVHKIDRSFDTSEKLAENLGGSGIGGDGGGILGTVIGLGMAQPIAQTMAGTMANTINSITPNVQTQPQPPESKERIIQLLQQLGDLKTAGILTDEEFAEKKKELLGKL
jgi:uncharacterized protein YcfJ